MMKKIWLKKIAAVTAAFLFLTMLHGSSQAAPQQTETKKDPVVNESYTEEMDLVSVTGNLLKNGDRRLVPFPGFGFALLIPEAWGIMEDLTEVSVPTGICIGFIPPSLMPDLENISEEEADQLDMQTPLLNQLNLVKVFYLPSDVSEDEVKAQNSDYQSIEKLAALDGNNYYMAYNETVSTKDHPLLSETDIERYAVYASEIKALKENAAVFPIQQLRTVQGITSEQIQKLQGTDLKGNQIDAGIFQQHELTMVNIWATWCGPCVSELPDLAELYRSLPANTGLLTICSNGSEEKEAAGALLEECSAEFVTVCGDEKLRSEVLPNIYSYPTTIFVDRNGQIVGNRLVGAYSAEVYRNEMEKCLKEMEKEASSHKGSF